MKEIAKQKTLTEPEFLEVIQSEAKRRRESIDEFSKAGRNTILPIKKKPSSMCCSRIFLSDDVGSRAKRGSIEAAVKTSGAKTPQEMGKVMSVLMPQIKGRADGKQAQQMVQQLLKSS